MNQNEIALAILLLDVVICYFLSSILLDEVRERYSARTRKRTVIQALSVGAIFLLCGAMAYFLNDTYRRMTIPYKETTYYIPATGVVPGGNLSWSITWDKFGTQNVTEIAWGEFCPDQQQIKNVTMYVRNNEDYATMTVTMWKQDFAPSELEKYFTLSWNFDQGGRGLGPHRQRKVTMYLYLNASITGDPALLIGEPTPFNFTIYLEGYKVDT